MRIEMKRWHTYFITFMLIAFTHSASMAKDEPEAQNLITEIWCVDGFRFLYVEKTTNETFQFFQLTRNGGMAPKVVECNGTEVRKID